ncbi:unnamed protein product [Closterium sp. NIES-65]|nr:unnamed protein product [Closterium sp. NIES-65]
MFPFCACKLTFESTQKSTQSSRGDISVSVSQPIASMHPWVMVKVPQGAEQVPASQPNAGSVGGRNQRHRMLQRQLFVKEQWQKVKEQKKEALKRRDEERRARWKAGAARAREWRERQLAAAAGGGGGEGVGATV